MKTKHDSTFLKYQFFGLIVFLALGSLLPADRGVAVELNLLRDDVARKMYSISILYLAGKANRPSQDIEKEVIRFMYEPKKSRVRLFMSSKKVHRVYFSHNIPLHSDLKNYSQLPSRRELPRFLPPVRSERLLNHYSVAYLAGLLEIRGTDVLDRIVRVRHRENHSLLASDVTVSWLGQERDFSIIYQQDGIWGYAGHLPGKHTQSYRQANGCGTRPLAFPGAKGFAKCASGGRGGRVIHVTNTRDAGPGSLRQALEVESGKRIIVFDVGGIIQLKDKIAVDHGNVTLAGQTAPGSGITLRGAMIYVRASNVIIRGLRIRPGDGAGDIPRARDSISVGTQTRPYPHDVIVDSNSFTWAVDETVSAWLGARGVTFSNNIIAKALHDSIHRDEPNGQQKIQPRKPHSMGVLLGPEVKKVTLIGNLLANNHCRNPASHAVEMEFLNNYVYDYRCEGTILYGQRPLSHVINNYYHERPGIGKRPIELKHHSAGTRTYVKGNLSKFFRPTLRDPVAPMVRVTPGYEHNGWTSQGPLFPPSETDLINADDLAAHIQESVGARWPVMDRIDRDIVKQTLNGRGQRIDTPSQDGGYEKGIAGRAPTDSDRDGIPDEFEIAIHSDPSRKDANQDVDKDGFSNIEEYLNGIITGLKD